MRLGASLVTAVCVSLAGLSGAVQGALPPQYVDASDETGLGPRLPDALNHAVAWGDLDGDGRLDLFLGNFCDRSGKAAEQANGLFRQTQQGAFEPLAAPAVATRGRTSGAVLVDLDNDGDLDLYVNNNRHTRPSDRKAKNEPSALYRNDGGRFVNVSAASGTCPSDGAFGRDVGVLDYDGDGLLDLLVIEDKVFQEAGHSRLYRNLGGMRFENVTAQAGLPTDLHGFGVAIGDASGDGRPDIYVCGSDRLFLGAAGGRFTEAVSLRQVFDIGSRNAEEYVVGAVFGDIDNDGDADLIVGTHFAPSRVRVYLNEGVADDVPRFHNVTKELGVPELPHKVPTCAVQDFDNDGMPDLYWSVWFAEGKKREPFICRGLGVKDGLPRFAVPSLDGLDMSLRRRNAVPAGKRGMVYYVDGPPVDYDGDGDFDFFAGAWPEEGSRLLRCDSPATGNWLDVCVVGTRMNRMGIGAKVRAMGGGKVIGYREVSLSGGYSGSAPAIVHFGLGTRTSVDLEVTFQGRREPLALGNVKANQRLVVTERQ
ncbi:MAG TPA: CRTAC1 family protein [Phycisphaerae bacterium]|nr:CRTAC1 family protein [Phycisphaerae bacterium]